jgi:hypothetical protein
LDVIKTKLQAQGGFIPVKKQGGHVGHPKMYNGLVGTARTIWRTEGIRGMYRGLGPIVMGYLPTWAVWFTVYNKSKNFLSQRYSMLRPAYRCTSVVPNPPRLRTTPPLPTRLAIKTILTNMTFPRARIPRQHVLLRRRRCEQHNRHESHMGHQDPAHVTGRFPPERCAL